MARFVFWGRVGEACALLRLGGQEKKTFDLGVKGGGSCFTPHVMRSTSAARQCRVWNNVTLGCMYVCLRSCIHGSSSSFLGTAPVDHEGSHALLWLAFGRECHLHIHTYDRAASPVDSSWHVLSHSQPQPQPAAEMRHGHKQNLVQR